MKAFAGFTCGVVVSFAVWAATAASEDDIPEPYPREGAVKLLENDKVIVWRVRFGKGAATPMHRHALDHVAIFLKGGRMQMTRPDGRQETRELRTDRVYYVKAGLTHSELALDDDVEAYSIEIKKP